MEESDTETFGFNWTHPSGQQQLPYEDASCVCVVGLSHHEAYAAAMLTETSSVPKNDKHRSFL